MKRHIFLIPGFFGFANLGDFAYWGPVYVRLKELFDDSGVVTRIHTVKSLPTASLRQRTLALLTAISRARPGRDDMLHLVGHSTGGLDARLLLTPAVDLGTRMSAEAVAVQVRSSTSVATPHYGAPIASFFTGLLGRQLLRLLSLATILAIRNGRIPLSVWARMAGMFSTPTAFDRVTGSLVGQIHRQLLADFDDSRSAQVEELLGEVMRDQSLLTQLTVEALDLFNAAAGNRDTVAYASVVTRARPPSIRSSLDAGLDPTDQAQLALYASLSRLAVGYDFPKPDAAQARVMRMAFGANPQADDSDGIVPTLSQPWGQCLAAVQADHLDIIGHHGGSPTDREKHYDWLTTNSDFREPDFDAVWQSVASFIMSSE